MFRRLRNSYFRFRPPASSFGAETRQNDAVGVNEKHYEFYESRHSFAAEQIAACYLSHTVYDGRD